MSGEGHAARRDEMKNANEILVGKDDRKKSFERI
jgi:hypothetical protein